MCNGETEQYYSKGTNLELSDMTLSLIVIIRHIRHQYDEYVIILIDIIGFGFESESYNLGATMCQICM